MHKNVLSRLVVAGVFVIVATGCGPEVNPAQSIADGAQQAKSPAPEAGKLTGTIVIFHPHKGYGFIRPDDGGDDVFVKFVDVVMDGRRSLERGDRVEYRIGDLRQAIEVVLLPGS